MSTLTEHLAKVEGLRLKAYQDSAGVWTIGYGHTGPDVFEGMEITNERAEDLLWSDIAWAMAAVEREVRVPLDEQQETALISFVFNIGAPKFKKSTLLRKLNTGDYGGAADEFLKWDKITVQGKKIVEHGLSVRRATERSLFQSNADTINGGVYPGTVTGGEAKDLIKSKTQWLAGGGIFTSALALWSEFKMAAPELLGIVAPYLPFAFAAIFVGVLVNRYIDSKNGVH